MNDRDKISALPLLFTAFFVMLTAVQFLRPLLASMDNAASVSGPSDTLRTHTREEVGGKTVDLSSEARHGLRLLVSEVQQQARMPEYAEEAEVDIAPTRHLMHRRVAPSAPDDSFPSLVN